MGKWAGEQAVAAGYDGDLAGPVSCRQEKSRIMRLFGAVLFLLCAHRAVLGWQSEFCYFYKYSVSFFLFPAG
ncbi:MAG TPA: hypothetical protein DEA26_08635 [Oceanospirillales bacterium]|nr:hypothetical protein [Oceanospirillaceae bacterium]HBS42732.1 hypothetical protein [Oceanospirillales bacterium]